MTMNARVKPPTNTEKKLDTFSRPLSGDQTPDLVQIEGGPWSAVFVGSSFRRIPMSGLAGSLSKSVALWRAGYIPSATKRPIGFIREEKGFFPVPGSYLVNMT